MDEVTAHETVEETPPATNALRRWVIEHEDRWSFLFLYVGAGVLLSLFISLFWLVVVVVFHFLLEWVRYAQEIPDRRRVFGESFWEVKLDASLVLIALALSVYIPVIFGVLGLSTAARVAGASARFVVWQRVIRGFALTIDDVLLVLRGVTRKLLGKKKAPKTEAAAEEKKEEPLQAEEAQEGPDLPSWRGRWSVMDWASIGLGVVSLSLIVLAPWITDHTYASTLHEILSDLHPWPI